MRSPDRWVGSRGSLASSVRVVAITDRRRMVPAALLAAAANGPGRDPSSDGDWAAVVAAFAAAIERAVADCPAGSVIVQIREKDLDGRAMLSLVRAALPLAPVVVNDRLDVALAAGADGVHLPERGLSIADARAIADARTIADAAETSAATTSASAPGPLLIGVSRHAAPGDTGADLVHLGSIWPTPSKPTTSPLGESALACPHGSAALVAVGGIDSPARAELAAASGADAVAIIRAAWTGASVASFVTAVHTGRARR